MCPIDRQVVDMARVHPDVAMKRVDGNLKVKCVEHKIGCTWTQDIGDLDTHHYECELQKPEKLHN